VAQKVRRLQRGKPLKSPTRGRKEGDRETDEAEEEDETEESMLRSEDEEEEGRISDGKSKGPERKKKRASPEEEDSDGDAARSQRSRPYVPAFLPLPPARTQRWLIPWTSYFSQISTRILRKTSQHSSISSTNISCVELQAFQRQSLDRLCAGQTPEEDLSSSASADDPISAPGSNYQPHFARGCIIFWLTRQPFCRSHTHATFQLFADRRRRTTRRTLNLSR
jgi:hypothetical protein